MNFRPAALALGGCAPKSESAPNATPPSGMSDVSSPDASAEASPDAKVCTHSGDEAIVVWLSGEGAQLGTTTGARFDVSSADLHDRLMEFQRLFPASPLYVVHQDAAQTLLEQVSTTAAELEFPAVHRCETMDVPDPPPSDGLGGLGTLQEMSST